MTSVAWRKAYEKTPAFREKKRIYFAKRRLDPAYRRKQAEYQHTWKVNHWLRRLVFLAHRRAVSGGLESDKAYMLALEKTNNCQSCGVAFDMNCTPTPYKPREAAPTLDRINCSLGYIAGNVGIICWRCNRIKSDATKETLRAILTYMERA